jgi:hypothetical protein
VYSVVVLPEPVGPVTSRMPCGSISTSRNSQCVLLETQRKSSATPPLSRIASPPTRRASSAPWTRAGRSPCPAHAAGCAVLRQAALRDVEVGHDLDPRNHRRGQPLGRRLHIVQHAVDAIPDVQLVLERLDVDIKRACPARW